MCGIVGYVGVKQAAPILLSGLSKLEYRGYDVTFVQNFTDIDDKMIKRAHEENTTVDAIAERYFKINCAVFTPNDQRMKDIVQMAKDLHADGIVDVALQFCTLYEMESFAVEKAAEEAGIPFMHITTDYAGEDAGQLQTRIEAFLETI